MLGIRHVLLLCCVLAAAVTAEKYTNKYDNIDLKEILENERLLVAYVNCIMERGKCTPEGKELKEHMQEAMETGCEKCTDSQKDGTYTVIEFLIKNRLDLWKELCAKYDPSGKYRKKYEDLAREKGIEIPAA